MQTLRCFPPVVNTKSKVLILGSMPGDKSLKLKQYYGNPLNQFWKIMANVLDCEFTPIYKEKLDLLLEHKVALWDTIDSCQRKGSADSKIKNPTINDIESLLKKYLNIRAVFCNGQTSHKLFIKYHPHFSLPLKILPSSSPALTKPLKWKIREWKKSISPYLLA